MGMLCASFSIVEQIGEGKMGYSTSFFLLSVIEFHYILLGCLTLLLDTMVEACLLKDHVAADLEKVFELADNSGIVLLFLICDVRGGDD